MTFGVDPNYFSNACIDELADSSINAAKYEALRSSPWRSLLEGRADVTAVLVSEILLGQGAFYADKIREQIEAAEAPLEWKSLAKHDPRFAIDQLGTTKKTAWKAASISGTAVAPSSCAISKSVLSA